MLTAIQSAVKNVFIRGSVVRYVHLPSSAVDTALLEDATRRGERDVAMTAALIHGRVCSASLESSIGHASFQRRQWTQWCYEYDAPLRHQGGKALRFQAAGGNAAESREVRALRAEAAALPTCRGGYQRGSKGAEAWSTADHSFARAMAWERSLNRQFEAAS